MVRQYVGARYVPRFRGEYDITTEYDGLDVVDNGVGTSYIARKPVPPNTPLTNTEYWFVYGASSGAIVELQNRMGTAENDIDSLETRMLTAEGDIDSLEKTLSGRRFILIGDSFGYGITPPSYSYDNGKGWIDHFEETCGQFCDVYYANVAVLPGVAGFASSLTFQTMLESLATTITDKDSITDIVVLGGTNDKSANGVTNNAIKSNIGAFMNYCRANYPRAKVKIGILSSDISTMYNDSAHPLEAYRCCTKYGAEFIHDGIGLYINPYYLCSDNVHLTQEGYSFYTEYVNNLIISGHCSYQFELNNDLTWDTTKVVPTSPAITINTIYTEKYVRFLLRDNNYTGFGLAIQDTTGWAGTRLNLTDCLTPTYRFNLPVYANNLAGGICGVKNNTSADISLASSWRLYNTDATHLTMQLNPPLCNPHSSDSDYITIAIVDSTHQLIVPID